MLEREPLGDAAAGGGAQRLPGRRGLVGAPGDRVGERLGILGLDQQPGAGNDLLGDPVAAGADHRQPARHRLEHRERERVGARRAARTRPRSRRRSSTSVCGRCSIPTSRASREHAAGPICARSARGRRRPSRSGSARGRARAGAWPPSTNRSLPLRVETTATVPTVNGRGLGADLDRLGGHRGGLVDDPRRPAAPGEPRGARRGRPRRSGRASATRRGAAVRPRRSRGSISCTCSRVGMPRRRAISASARVRIEFACTSAGRRSARKRAVAAHVARRRREHVCAGPGGSRRRRESCTRTPAGRRRRPSRGRRARRTARSASGPRSVNSQPRSLEQRHDPLDRAGRPAEVALVKADDDPHRSPPRLVARRVERGCGRKPGPRIAAVSEPVISVAGLRKSYGDFEAVRGLDLEVRRGEVFAFLGPNGAGKTTTAEILEGYRERSARRGLACSARTRRAPTATGASGSGSSSSNAGCAPSSPCARRSSSTPATTATRAASTRRSSRSASSDKADARAGSLSGGQLRRLDVGVALIGDPELLFLDEPTTGFDPTARRQAWDVIAGLRELGKTVFLTTHYMDEAQRLADRVAIIVGGRIVAAGPPERARRPRAPAGDDPLPAARRASPPASCRSSWPPRRREDGDARDRGPRDPVGSLHELTGWALERGDRARRARGRAARASRTSTSSSPPRRAGGRRNERRRRSPCTSSASTRRSSGATRPRSSSPCCCR